jgi:hypothetical protein
MPVNAAPRYGTRIFTVTELHLSGPDAKYFEVPAGYKMVDMRPGPEKTRFSLALLKRI